MSSEKPAFDPRLHALDEDEDDKKPPAREIGGGARKGSEGARSHQHRPNDGEQVYRSIPHAAAAASTSVAAAASRHSGNSDSDEDETDEAMARRLQEELDQQDELCTREKSSSEEADAALALRLMREGSSRIMHNRTMSADEDPESLELALRLHEEQQQQDQDQQQNHRRRTGHSSADEDLARSIFEESLASREHRSGHSKADEVLARQLFEESLSNVTGEGGDLGFLPKEETPKDDKRQQFQQGMKGTSQLQQVDDEALARQLFEQSLANFRENTSSVGDALPGETDEEFARRYFNHSMDILRGGGRGRDSDRNHQSDEALARRLQMQQINEGRQVAEQQQMHRSEDGLSAMGRPSGAAVNNDRNDEDDAALARRMQNLEALGMGSSNEKPVPGAPSPSDSELKLLRRLRQEQEDEYIARQVALQGSNTDKGKRHSFVAAPGAGSRRSSGDADDDSSARRRSFPSGALAGNQRESGAASAVGPPAQRRMSGGAAIPPAAPTGGGGNTRRREQHPGESYPPPIVDPMPTGPEMASAPGEAGSAEKRKKRGGGLLGKLMNRRPGGGTDGQPLPPEALPIPPPPSRTNSKPGPIPHSVSISHMLPILPHPTQLGGQQGGGRRGVGPGNAPAPPMPAAAGGGAKKSNVPICSVCKKPAPSYLSTLDKKYHPECFNCMGCHTAIDHSLPFAFTVGQDGEKHPLHRKCYAELYGIKCAVCRQSIPTGADGKVSYVKHPFFDKERMCPRHAQNPGRRCTGCHRFEPEGSGFADLGDADRCVCLSCCRTVIVDSDDAKPLWEEVVQFFDDLGLTMWGDMRDVPVLVVGHDALNDQLKHSQGSAHNGSSQIMTRGLCLSEHQSGRRIPMQRIHYDRGSGTFMPADAEERGYTFFQVPDPDKRNPNSSVTAILCMSGLPRDLTASILAHEATHAWFKLHPNFDVRRPIPLKVEEGCCQLMAYLFLQYLDRKEPASTSESNGPSDEKLRQYFKFSIETDENDVYGMGYRMAAEAYAVLGIEALLGHIVRYREFPIV